jgi:hypothetical protein
VESFLIAVGAVGAAVLVGGSIALVAFAFLPEGPRRLRLAGLAFRATGLGLGSTWVAIGLLWLAPGMVSPASLIPVSLTVAGAIIIWVSLRTKRPIG